MPNKRSLPRMSSVQGLAPAFHLARHPVHDDVAGILTVMTSNRKTSSFHSVRCCRIQALSSFCLFLSISLLVFFALICTGIERIIASQNANTTSGCQQSSISSETIRRTLLDDHADRLSFMIIPRECNHS